MLVLILESTFKVPERSIQFNVEFELNSMHKVHEYVIYQCTADVNIATDSIYVRRQPSTPATSHIAKKILISDPSCVSNEE